MPTPGQAPFQTGTSTSDMSADPSFVDQVKGMFWQELPPSDDYHEAPRGNGLLQIPGNVFRNAGDWGQGLATMGSIAGARMLETATGQSPIRATDMDDLMNFAGSLINDYKTGYVDPIVQGRPQDIYNRLATRPLDVASDLMAVSPGLKAVARGTGLAKAAEAVRMGASSSAAKLFGGVEQRVLASETVGPLAQKIKAAQLEKSIIGGAQQAVHHQFQLDEHLMDAAAKKVPLPERERLRGIVEGHDPMVFREGYSAVSKEAQEYMDVNRHITDDSQRRLQQMDNVTKDQLVRERWKPMLKEYFKAHYGISEDVDLAKFSDRALNKLISEVMEYAKSKGIDPSYMPRMTAKNIKSILDNPGEVPEWLTTHMARRARALVEGLPFDEAPKTPFEIERTKFEAGAHYDGDPHQAAKARRLQVLQAHELLTRMMHAVLDAAQDIKGMTPEAVAAMDANQGLMRFSPRKFFGNLMHSPVATTPFDAAQILTTFFPEEVFIPKPLGMAMGNISKWKVGTLEKIFQGFANFARRYVLGFNMLWPEKQFGQNLIMLGMFQFTGPKDALVSFASYALMRDAKIRALIPEWIKGESFAADAGTPLLGGKLGKMHQGLEKVVDFTFTRGQFYDQLSRATAAVYYGLKLSERAELAGPIKGMMSTGEAINRLEQVFSNAAWTEQVGKKVITVLGDYSRMAAKSRQTLRSMLLWWMWYEHIIKFAMALPDNAPIKTALLTAIAETHTRLREDAEGMPEGLKQAGAVKLNDMENEQGVPLYTLGGSLNPFTTLTEMLEFVQQPVEGAESSTLLGATNPVFTLASALLFGINPQTGRGFRDPRLVSVGGRQYKSEDLDNGLLQERTPRPLMAGGLEYAARTFFPQPARLAERIFAKAATGGEPSQFTSVLSGEAAPRVVYDSGGEPLAAGSYLDIVKEAMLGQRAFPIDEDATIQNEGMDDYRMRKALRARDKQIRTED